MRIADLGWRIEKRKTIDFILRLQEAGVQVTLSRYRGMIHAFVRMTARLDKAKEALDEIAGTLRGVF